MIEERLHRYARPDELFCLNESIVSDPVISLHTHDFIELSYIRKGHAIHVPVSYTHLDVYKRQSQDQGKNGKLRARKLPAFHREAPFRITDRASERRSL